MRALHFDETSIHLLITHHIGNKLKEGELLLTDDLSPIEEELTASFLKAYFLDKFKPYGFQQFTHSSDLELNEAYGMVKAIFNDQTTFIQHSKNLAGLLFDTSDHHLIKEGEMNLVYFNNLNLDGELFDAIGIFKSESIVPFIQMIEEQKKYTMYHDFGFALNGLDKACLIINQFEDEGYTVLTFDKTNGNGEAQFWNDKFLRLAPVDDGYNNTKSFLQSTQHFVTENLAGDQNVSKTDQLDLLDKTMDFFKTRDNFDKREFTATVLEKPELIEKFEDYGNTIRSRGNQSEQFEISDKAVKSQSKIYKSILKLDKNFHVYIHGDRSKIERGVDEDGRKFYKLYFDNEA
jgi:hypothetical protein